MYGSFFLGTSSVLLANFLFFKKHYMEWWLYEFVDDDDYRLR